jgi:hypothetical protein
MCQCARGAFSVFTGLPAALAIRDTVPAAACAHQSVRSHHVQGAPGDNSRSQDLGGLAEVLRNALGRFLIHPSKHSESEEEG